MKATRRRTKNGRLRPRRPREIGTPAEIVDLSWDDSVYHVTNPGLTGGDIDADWRGAYGVGDDALGGTAATPDQSVLDEVGDALGLSQPSDAEFRTSSEILDERDRHRWARDGMPSRRRRA
jgi:Family of unknown function (DUF6335)